MRLAQQPMCTILEYFYFFHIACLTHIIHFKLNWEKLLSLIKKTKIISCKQDIINIQNQKYNPTSVDLRIHAHTHTHCSIVFSLNTREIMVSFNFKSLLKNSFLWRVFSDGSLRTVLVYRMVAILWIRAFSTKTVFVKLSWKLPLYDGFAKAVLEWLSFQNDFCKTVLEGYYSKKVFVKTLQKCLRSE